MRPSGVVDASDPLREYRSQSSRVGSAWGDFRALASFFTLTAGGLNLSAEGEEIGDELLARFLLRRCIIGDRADT